VDRRLLTSTRSSETLGKQVAAPARVLDPRRRPALQLSDQREVRGLQLGHDRRRVEEEPVELDGPAEPVPEVVDLAGLELGTVDVERNQQPAAGPQCPGQLLPSCPVR